MHYFNVSPALPYFLAVISYWAHTGPQVRLQRTKLLSWLKFFSLNMLSCSFLNYSKNTKPGEPCGYHHKCRLNPVMSLAVAHHDRLAENGDLFLWIIISCVSHEIINGYTCGPMFYSAKSVKWSCNQFTLSLCSLWRLLYVSFGKLICLGIYLVCHCFVYTGDAKVVMCGVGSFAEQVINVPTKHSVPLLNSHELPCLRLYSSSRSKVIISRPFKVATVVAV